MKNKWIKGRNVIITGVSSGIGRELALLLSKDLNCKILGIARNEEKLKNLQVEIGADNFIYYIMDVSEYDSWKAFSLWLKKDGFQPDIIINNAGIIHPFQRFDELSDTIIEKVIKTNYLSVLYSCRTMLPFILESDYATIINVSSASALLPIAGASIYSSTKSATYSFTDALREELMGSGVYVAFVLPGPVRTGLYDTPSDGKNSTDIVANKKLFSNFGLTAERAARIIINKMQKKKGAILVGQLAKYMQVFNNLMPIKSIIMTGRMMRAIPLKTFKGIFYEEKQYKLKIKMERRFIKYARKKMLNRKKEIK